MHSNFLNSLLISCFIVTSCFSQKSKSRSFPFLEIKIMHEWEKIIAETSIDESSVGFDTHEEIYRHIHPPEKNTFILHYKIATVEKVSFTLEDSCQKNRQFKEYKLFYDTTGNLTEVDEVSYKRHYFYDNQGELDSTSLYLSSIGGVSYRNYVNLEIGKEIKTWDKVKGKTGWSRLTEKELYGMSFYIKKKKTEYSFLSKICYFYSNDGLLSEIKTFNEAGILKCHSKFIYTFYK